MPDTSDFLEKIEPKFSTRKYILLYRLRSLLDLSDPALKSKVESEGDALHFLNDAQNLRLLCQIRILQMSFLRKDHFSNFYITATLIC